MKLTHPSTGRTIEASPTQARTLRRAGWEEADASTVAAELPCFGCGETVDTRTIEDPTRLPGDPALDTRAIEDPDLVLDPDSFES